MISQIDDLYHTHYTPVYETELMYDRCEQGHTHPQTCSNTLQIHQIKFDKRVCNLAVFSNEDLTHQEKGQVQFKFNPKGSSFIPWQQGTHLYATATMICQC